MNAPTDLVTASQGVAGIIAARSRGDRQGASQLMADLGGPEEIAGGAIVVAELLAAQLAHASGESVPDCTSALCLDLERALDGS